MTLPPVRHLVIDSQAAQALLSTDPNDKTRAAVIEAILAANGRQVAPTTARGEAGWSRTDPAALRAHHLVSHDDALDRLATDRAVQLRSVVPDASLAAATMTVAAERLERADVVELLTADPREVAILAGQLDVNTDIRRVPPPSDI